LLSALTFSSEQAATLAHGLRITPDLEKPLPISTRRRLFAGT